MNYTLAGRAPKLRANLWNTCSWILCVAGMIMAVLTIPTMLLMMASDKCEERAATIRRRMRIDAA